MKKQQIFPFFFFVSFTSSSIDNQQRKKKDRFFLLLLLSYFRLRMRGRRRRGSQDDKREAAFRTKPFSLIILKVRSRAQKSVRILLRPVVLSVVFALKDRRLSFRRRMWWEKKKYTRARREKIRICAIVPLSAMISSSSSESTSIEVIIYDDESNTRSRRPLRLSLSSLLPKVFCFVHFLLWSV